MKFYDIMNIIAGDRSIEFACSAYARICVAHRTKCFRSDTPTEALTRSKIAIRAGSPIPVVIPCRVASLAVNSLSESPAGADEGAATAEKYHQI